jgi:hypothetical protein
MLMPKVVELRLPTILLDGDAAAYVTVPSGANVKLYSDLLNGCRRRSTGARRPSGATRRPRCCTLRFGHDGGEQGPSSLRLPTLLRGPSDRIVSESGLDSEEETHTNMEVESACDA